MALFCYLLDLRDLHKNLFSSVITSIYVQVYLKTRVVSAMISANLIKIRKSSFDEFSSNDIFGAYKSFSPFFVSNYLNHRLSRERKWANRNYGKVGIASQMCFVEKISQEFNEGNLNFFGLIYPIFSKVKYFLIVFR